MKDDPSETEQAKRFREAARALECDDDEVRFDARLKKVAKGPPSNSKTPTKGD